MPLLDQSGRPVTWFTAKDATTEKKDTEAFHLIRRAGVYTVSEELKLAEEPIATSICGGDEWIETDALLTGLEAGRWLIVSGERSDIPGTSGVTSSELVMLGAVRNTVETAPGGGRSETEREDEEGEPDPAPFLPGDTVHTYLQLAEPLAYCYRRSTVTINANVVTATHGETRNETLGAGDGARRFRHSR